MKLLSVILLTALTICSAQTSDLYMTKNFLTAYENQTRSLNGLPGPAYWQNRADYTIRISLDPATRIITGTEKRPFPTSGKIRDHLQGW